MGRLVWQKTVPRILSNGWTGVAVELPKPALNYRDEPMGDVQPAASRPTAASFTEPRGITSISAWSIGDEAGRSTLCGRGRALRPDGGQADGYGGARKYNLADRMWTTATNTNVSRTGNTSPVRSGGRHGRNWSGERNELPAFFNTETGKTVIFEELRRRRRRFGDERRPGLYG